MKPQIQTLNLAKLIWILLWVVGFLWIGTASVNAHRVNLFARVEGDRIYVESKFSGGKHVNAARIIVTDDRGTELLSGTTDEKGEFSFKVPQKSDLKIILLAGTGHRAEWTIAASEITGSASGMKLAPQKGDTAKKLLIGLGCIFALTAIIAYFRNRRKKNINHENTKI